MINNHYWTTRDGRKIPTSDMKDSHAMNSAKMLQRKTGFRSKTEKETWQEYLSNCMEHAELQATLYALTDPNL